MPPLHDLGEGRTSTPGLGVTTRRFGDDTTPSFAGPTCILLAGVFVLDYDRRRVVDAASPKFTRRHGDGGEVAASTRHNISLEAGIKRRNASAPYCTPVSAETTPPPNFPPPAGVPKGVAGRPGDSPPPRFPPPAPAGEAIQHCKITGRIQLEYRA